LFRKKHNTQQVLQLHGPLVMKIIWSLVPSNDDAQDIFQDTFLQHHLAFTRGQTIRNPKAWLCTTARNAAFKLRRLRKRQAVPMADEVLNRHPAKPTNPDHFLMLEKIRDLAATLPEKQAQVFAMRNFEQMSFAEIAQQLCCTEEAARASGYKALKKIRSILSDRQEDSHV
jgi:RNA polymerase sigma-70 factor, ECF subfamily